MQAFSRPVNNPGCWDAKARHPCHHLRLTEPNYRIKNVQRVCQLRTEKTQTRIELSMESHRTKGATSQELSRLEMSGLNCRPSQVEDPLQQPTIFTARRRSASCDFGKDFRLRANHAVLADQGQLANVVRVPPSGHRVDGRVRLTKTVLEV